MTGAHRQLIGGDWVEATNGGTWDPVDPATEQVIEPVPYGDGADVIAAIYAASEAFKAWASTNVYQRAAILRGAADLLKPRVDDPRAAY